jgi:ethanolamine ammonia-lyase large subunit
MWPTTMARPMTATELRNEPTIEYDKTTIGRPFELKNPEWHIYKRVNTYMVDSLRNYEINRMNDETLWEMLQEDFEN